MTPGSSQVPSPRPEKLRAFLTTSVVQVGAHQGGGLVFSKLALVLQKGAEYLFKKFIYLMFLTATKKPTKFKT